jgi:hypothetical protein
MGFGTRQTRLWSLIDELSGIRERSGVGLEPKIERLLATSVV